MLSPRRSTSSSVNEVTTLSMMRIPLRAKAKYPFCFHARHDIYGLVEAFVRQWRHLDQVHQALQLVQHHFQLVPVARKPFHQPEQVFQVEVFLDFLELLDRQAVSVVRAIGIRSDISSARAWRWRRRSAPVRSGKPPACVRARFFGQFQHGLIHDPLLLLPLASHGHRAGKGSSCPLSSRFQYIQRNIILPQWFISVSCNRAKGSDARQRVATGERLGVVVEIDQQSLAKAGFNKAVGVPVKSRAASPAHRCSARNYR